MTFKLGKNILYITLFLLAFFYFRLVEIDRPVWSDEYITLSTVEVNPILNPLYNRYSTNLPLYYYLVKIVSFISTDIYTLRSLNILLSLLTILFIYKKYENFSSLTKKLIIIFIGFAPIQIYYSIELRTYVLAQLLIVINFYYFQKKDFNKWFYISTFFLLITHYSCLIYLLAIYLSMLISKTSKKEVVKLTSLGFLGVFILYLISQNTGFSDSTASTVLNQNFRRFSLSNFGENILRLREVITIYYHYGLHYYRIENEFLSNFKKGIQFLFFIYGLYLLINFKSLLSYPERAKNILFFALLMLITIFFDLLGIIPFGGRHIFPFYFFFLLIFSDALKMVFDYSKKIGITLSIVVLLSYFSYNFCLSLNLDIFVGNNDPQGSLFNKCINR